MMKQESQLYPEEIQAEKEGLFEVIETFSDGTTLEEFFDPEKREEPTRVYARNSKKELVGFADLDRLNNIDDYVNVKRQIAEKLHIVLTDEEAKRITRKLYENIFQRFGPQKSIEE